MKKLLILIAVLSIVACSTDKRGKQAKAKFENNIWIIDSMRKPIPITSENPSGLMTVIPNTILKPQVDSTFGLYREQFVRYKDYYFSGDSIFLSEGKLDNKNKIYKAYKYNYKADKLVLSSTDKLFESRDLYLTNLTKIFKGENDVIDSTYYKSLKNESWYLNKFQISDSVIYNINEPKHYLFNWALYRDDENLHFPYLSNFYPKLKYKFSKNGLYLYDIVEEKIINSFKIIEFQEDRNDFIRLIGVNGMVQTNIKFKIIDKTLLEKNEDIPKSYFINCTITKARKYFLEYFPISGSKGEGFSSNAK